MDKASVLGDAIKYMKQLQARLQTLEEQAEDNKKTGSTVQVKRSIIFTNDDELHALIDSIHVHGKGTDKYDNVRIGYNSRLDTFQAVVLLQKLTLFKDELDKRNAVAAAYTERLKDTFETPVVLEGYGSSWAQYTLKAKNKEERDKVVEEMKTQGIPVMVYYPIPIHRSGAYKHLNAKNLPVTEELSDKVFSIPMHPYLEIEEIDLICDTLIKIVNR